MEIYKLKVTKINKYHLNVETKMREKGNIHISEISYRYIDDLQNFFELGDEVYGQYIGDFKGEKSFSLKKGHTKGRNVFFEDGGGFLVLKKFLKKMEEIEND